MSPDGEAIVTGAGDETLRFWNVFSKMRSTKVFTFQIPFSALVSLPFVTSLPVFVLPSSIISLPLLGIRISAEPLHQDPVVSTPLYCEGIKLGREFFFACIKL